MRLSPSNIQDSGLLVGHGVHDARIAALAIEYGKELALTLRRTDGHTVRLRLEGLGDVGMLDFHSGGIVLEVFVWAPGAAPATTLVAPGGAWAVLFAGIHREDELPDAARRVASAGRFAHLVHVTCSYGGSIAALCEAIDVEAIRLRIRSAIRSGSNT